MDLSDGLNLIIIAIVSLWSIYQIRITKRLEQEIHHLNIGLDQSIQILHRA